MTSSAAVKWPIAASWLRVACGRPRFRVRSSSPMDWVLSQKGALTFSLAVAVAFLLLHDPEGAFVMTAVAALHLWCIGSRGSSFHR